MQTMRAMRFHANHWTIENESIFKWKLNFYNSYSLYYTALKAFLYIGADPTFEPNVGSVIDGKRSTASHW